MEKKHQLNFLLKDCLPKNHSRQINDLYFLNKLIQDQCIKKVLDLGCGQGNSLDYFKNKNPQIKWFGLDINQSPEVARRTKKQGLFFTFDGVHIPFKDNFFDLIYCHQVLEHVQEPLILLKDACRVLKPQSFFTGSTSYLEPYHSYSLWNYTPYGLSFLIKKAGFNLKEMRPGIDGLTMIIRRGLGRPGFFSRWHQKQSPLNSIISFVSKAAGRNPVWSNALKLLFCGQICFCAYKPEKING